MRGRRQIIERTAINMPLKENRWELMLAGQLSRRRLNPKPKWSGDVPDTYADVAALTDDVGYKPNTPIEVGINNSSTGTASTTKYEFRISDIEFRICRTSFWQYSPRLVDR